MSDHTQEFLEEAADPDFVASLNRDLLLELYSTIMGWPRLRRDERRDLLEQLRAYKAKLNVESTEATGSEAQASGQEPQVAEGAERQRPSEAGPEGREDELLQQLNDLVALNEPDILRNTVDLDVENDRGASIPVGSSRTVQRVGVSLRYTLLPTIRVRIDVPPG